MSGRGEAVPPFSGLPVGTGTTAPPAERATLTAGEAESAGRSVPRDRDNGVPSGGDSGGTRPTGVAPSPAVSVDVFPDWKPAKRKKATPTEWRRMREVHRDARCVICGDPAQSLHHIVRKGGANRGDDVPANLAPVCGHGTRGCHGLIEARHRPTLSALRFALTDEQRAYVLAKKGEAWLDLAYPPETCGVCGDLGCEFCPGVPKEAA